MRQVKWATLEVEGKKYKYKVRSISYLSGRLCVSILWESGKESLIKL